MPIAKRYSIKEIISALEYYYTMTNRRIIIEYTLIEGVNNSFKHAKELSEVLSDLPCHVNLIKLNEVDGRELKSPTADSCKKFLDTLNRFGVSATQRRTLGDDIEGACGQLRNKELQGEKVVNKVNPNIKPKPNRNTLNKVKDASQLLKQKQSKDVSSKNNARNNGRTENKSFSKKDNSRVNKQNKPFANSKGRNQNNFSNKNYKRG